MPDEASVCLEQLLLGLPCRGLPEGRCWHDGHRRAAGDLSEAEQLFSLCLAAGDHDRVPAARAATRRYALQRSRIREQGPALPHEAVRERIAAIPGTPGPLTLTAS